MSHQRIIICLLHLLLLIGPCSVFHPAHLLFRDVDVQLPHQCFGNRPGDLEMSDFSSFAIFASRLSSIHYMIFPCSFLDFGSCYDILDLAEVADILVVNFIPQSVASDARLHFRCS